MGNDDGERRPDESDGLAIGQRATGLMRVEWNESVVEPRIISQAAWRSLVQRIIAMTRGGGETQLSFVTEWSGNVRWGRNRAHTSGDRRNNTLMIGRTVRGASASLQTNQLDDVTLQATISHVEQLLGRYAMETLEQDPLAPFQATDYLRPVVWFDSTFAANGEKRAEAAQRAIVMAEAAGMVTGGYLQVDATGVSACRPEQTMDLYYPITDAQYSLTVRNPQGTGSGWAGVSWGDWSRIDVPTLAATALDKCLRSQNPVALEPGRHTVILEAQAVYDLMNILVRPQILSWPDVLNSQGNHPYADLRVRIGTKLGQRLIDPRLTIEADPMDPELGVVPFTMDGEPIRAATWFKEGVLTQLAYNRSFAVRQGLSDVGMPASGAFRMSGNTPPVSMRDMIASTNRGVVITRLSDVMIADANALVMRGFTRDGTWLIERGKISKAIRNFRFSESPLFALNQVELIGAPQRVFCPGSAVIVPALKIRDFNLTALADAI